MKKTKRKPEVGEKLFYVRFDRRGNTEVEITITKVGRKYFEAEESWRKLSFHIDTWRLNSNYHTDARLYETKQEYLDEQKAQSIWREMSGIMSNFNCPFSLDQLERIKAIADEP